LWWTIGLTALTTFALAVALASWLGRFIAHSVGQAARATVALKDGGPPPPSGTPVAEVETLIGGPPDAAARPRAAEQDLEASNDRLQLAFDATKLGWWQEDLLRSTVLGDARFKEIFDVTADETSIEDIIQRLHPDDVKVFRATREAALDPANPK